MNLSAPLNELKRKAKLLRREAGIPLNQALTRIANQNGYASWGLLIRDYEAQKPKLTALPKTGYLIETLPVDSAFESKQSL